MSGACFVTGNGTGIGKTLVCAALCRKLKADYWKPIQAGNLDCSDSQCVSNLIADRGLHALPEALRLKAAMSPHAASEQEGFSIALSQIRLPEMRRNLIVEGAGGVFAPINRKELVVDLITELALPVIFVSRNYLGSINHTLLSIEALQARRVDLRGIIFNGPVTPSSEHMILEYTGVTYLGRLPELERVSAHALDQVSSELLVSDEHLRT